MFRSFSSRLALLLVTLVFVVTSAVATLLFFAHRLHLAEVQQEVNREVARHLVDDQLIFTEGSLNQSALKEIFHMMMVVHPSIELYLLDPEGTILAYSAPEGVVELERVPLAPVRRFLAEDRLPILGPDPRNPGSRKPFSAAEIPGESGISGYLYIIVGGEQYASVATMLRSSYVMRTALWALGIGLVAALLAGAWLARWQTARLRTLGDAVERFRSGELRELDAFARVSGEDELGQLARAFESMARRIDEQFTTIETADRDRRDLVASVSHDLRTPLAALRGYLETLTLKSDTLEDEERKRYLDVAIHHAERLSRLVDQLFELSKLEAGGIELAPEAFPAAELVQDVMLKFELQAKEKGISLSAAPGNPSLRVHADIGLIERVLTNVVENALKYTPVGGRIEARVEEQESQARIAIRDSGPGISREEIPRIFERSYRATDGSGGPEGSGLGLTIAQQILKLHGESMEVDSRRGAGAEFAFRLPIAV